MSTDVQADAGVLVYDASMQADYLQALDDNQAVAMADKYFDRSYFTPMIQGTKDLLGEDQVILQAPNKLCVVGLSTRHRLIDYLAQHPLHGILSIHFSDFITNATVSGKRKRQAAQVHPYSVIATARCGSISSSPSTVPLSDTDNSKEGQMVFELRACVRGIVLEWNEQLCSHPELLVQSSLSTGWLIVVKPVKDNLQGLVSRTEYDTCCDHSNANTVD